MQAISDFLANPSAAGSTLRPCLDKVMAHLERIKSEDELSPYMDRSPPPVFLGATAGMRLAK
jgi:hypothetical protein